jgi:hypothetical protein
MRVSPGCVNLMGPVVEGTTVPNGAKVPGTPFQLDPIRAAWNIGTMIRCAPLALLAVSMLTVYAQLARFQRL